MRHAGPRRVCDDWLHLAATDRAYKMTRDQRRMRSGYAGPPADWSICNRHWLWALDGRVAEPSRRKYALPPGLFAPHSLPAGRPGICCRGDCRIDRLGCDDGMVACRADSRRKMTHDPSSLFNVPREVPRIWQFTAHRGQTYVGYRPRASFNDSCGRACRRNYLAGAQWTALVYAAE
jgi:hypothetical protein